MNALVLSGGSVKGAFQAGAMKALIEKGFYPSFLYGISVGSLNATFINNEAGKQNVLNEKLLDWNIITENLITFWKENVRKPSDLIIKRKFMCLALAILRGKFNGITDTTPLRELVRRLVTMDNISRSPLKQKAGTVNFINGDIIYADPLYSDFLDFVIASSAIPIVMPAMLINSTPYFDGGLREIAPLKPAIQSGADSIVAILCQPEKLGTSGYSYQNSIQLLERMTDIMCNEIENNDIEYFNDINKCVPEDGSIATEGCHIGKRKLKLIVIRPENEIEVDISSFTSKDIFDMIDLGYNTAKDILSGVTVKWS